VSALTINPLSGDSAWLFGGDTAEMLRHVRRESAPPRQNLNLASRAYT